jgi:Lrp/AsnC family transcriptional regulator of ectoine degradation
MRLDARDLDILQVLSSEGRITKAALAERVGLSPTPCWERLKKLEKAGVIESYRANINLRKLGPHVTIFVAAELNDHTAASFQTFEAAMQRYDEVTACWALGGGFDYILQIVTRDIDAYQRLIDAMLDARIGLARYFTYVVTKPVKAGESHEFHVPIISARKSSSHAAM